MQITNNQIAINRFKQENLAPKLNQNKFDLSLKQLKSDTIDFKSKITFTSNKYEGFLTPAKAAIIDQLADKLINMAENGDLNKKTLIDTIKEMAPDLNIDIKDYTEFRNPESAEAMIEGALYVHNSKTNNGTLYIRFPEQPSFLQRKLLGKKAAPPNYIAIIHELTHAMQLNSDIKEINDIKKNVKQKFESAFLLLQAKMTINLDLITMDKTPKLIDKVDAETFYAQLGMDKESVKDTFDNIIESIFKSMGLTEEAEKKELLEF
ncbi:MAG: hypothetical protein AB7V50_10345, partial [Vampirovibrionia bacterium]